MTARVGPEPLETLRTMMDDGSVSPVIDRTLPLDQANEAIACLRSGRVRGKLTLTI
ncbi:zinc-binding dehydrogenase [Dactylosporangium sp. NPDC000555]|uniref:zinc-binding dehydrogenase n=1 Tax=Dactylosporangium sp. NPDC000555 TaxID=3154260 RepID=UPI00332B4E3B